MDERNEELEAEVERLKKRAWCFEQQRDKCRAEVARLQADVQRWMQVATDAGSEVASLRQQLAEAESSRLAKLESELIHEAGKQLAAARQPPVLGEPLKVGEVIPAQTPHLYCGNGEIWPHYQWSEHTVEEGDHPTYRFPYPWPPVLAEQAEPEEFPQPPEWLNPIGCFLDGTMVDWPVEITPSGLLRVYTDEEMRLTKPEDHELYPGHPLNSPELIELFRK